MRHSRLQSGQCVFCAFKQSWRASISTTAGRGGPRGIAEVAHIRRTASRPPRDRPKNRVQPSRVGPAALLAGQLRLNLSKPSKHSPEEHTNFTDVLRTSIAKLAAELPGWENLDSLGLTLEEREERLVSFEKLIHDSLAIANFRRGARVDGNVGQGKELAMGLVKAFEERGRRAFEAQLKYEFYGHVAAKRFSPLELQNQKELADLRYPLEWYPGTREVQRKIHLHVGPTNSGKTYHALKALEQARTGVYAGPLRLLAHEVFTRMNAKGKSCMLVTGEERRLPDNGDTNSSLISCTVEMIDVNHIMDVAVIDEIQMIGSLDRGWAWTQALIGVRAKEVHLCGEERSIPLIKELVALMGDKLEIHRYQRLTPLMVDMRHLNGTLRNLVKGDCVVSFSILGIHALRRQIESVTGKNVAIVYGSLPPETRAQQARLFNDPDNDYDFLVASDAIGMGLNLSIKRIIFESSQKNDGIGIKPLTVSQIKQIAGRAGRYRTSFQDNKDATSNLDAAVPEVEPKTEIVTASVDDVAKASARSTNLEDQVFNSEHLETGFESVSAESSDDNGLFPASAPSSSVVSAEEQTTGLVTTLYPFDLPVIRRGMNLEPEPLTSAGLFPPASVVERFTSYFPPSTPFSYILLRLHEISQMTPRFHLCGLKDALLIADMIHCVDNLSTADRIIFCAAPISGRNRDSTGLIVELARCVAGQKGGGLLELPPHHLQLEILERPSEGTRSYLMRLESLHKDIIVYLWLSYRFSGVFTTRKLAVYVKTLVEKKIEETIAQMSFSEKSRQRIRRSRELAAMEEMRKTYESMDEKETAVADVDGDGAVVPEIVPHAQERSPTANESVEGADESGDTGPLQNVHAIAEQERPNKEALDKLLQRTE